MLAACLLLAGPASAGRPMIIHQYQVVESPASASYSFYGYSVAIDGDWAIVTAGVQTPGGQAFRKRRTPCSITA